MISPANARIELADLPAEWRERVQKCLIGAWEDGFAVGVAHLPRRNPYDQPPADAQKKPKR